jgi:hypothetical protein
VTLRRAVSGAAVPSPAVGTMVMGLSSELVRRCP